MSHVVEIEVRNGLKLLSLDAGGALAVSQLQLLKNVMEKISYETEGEVKRPCEVFDAIGGAGTGGLISIFLVVLKMTAMEALEQFAKFAVEVYKDPDSNAENQTNRLKRAVFGVLDRYGIDRDMPLISANEPTPACRLIVPITYKINISVTCVLRNYPVRQDPPTNLTIAEAMLATCATAPTFSPIRIGKDFSTFEYISGDLGLSNPIREVIANVHRAFGNEATVACILSIGCGHPGVSVLPGSSSTTARTNFLERLAMDSEKVAQEIAAQMSQLTLYYRLSVNYGLEIIQPRAWQEPEVSTAHTTVYLADLEVVKLVDRCVGIINTGYGSATLEQLTHAGGVNNQLPPLPPLTGTYVERKVPMGFLEKALFDQNGQNRMGSKIVVVTGIGGCGKTQLVRKFVEEHKDRFISTMVVDGGSKDALRKHIVQHVRSLGAAHSQSSFDESMSFLSQSTFDGQRLLIIDNVDDPALDLAPFLPRWLNGVVIITSRNVSRGKLSASSHLQLDIMSLDESVELLVRGFGQEWPPLDPHRDTAITMAKELGCHPIALVQAVSYMSKTGYSAETYISRLRSCRESLLKDPAMNQVEMRYVTAFAAFDASYDILRSNAQKVLHLLSFFHRQNFPLELVILAAKGGFSINPFPYLRRGEEPPGIKCLEEAFCSSGEWNLYELDSIVTSLRNQSLVTVTSAGNITLLEMHSLVHEWSRLRIPQGMHEHFEAAAIRLLCCGATKGNISVLKYLFNHIYALSSAWEQLHANDAGSFAFILQQSGMYGDAVKLQRRTYETARSKLGVNHPHTLAASTNLAVMYDQLGRYSDAEELGVEILRQRKRMLGMRHPLTILASANLAKTYGWLGRPAEAEKLQIEVLRLQKQLFGAEHTSTIEASASLAVTYRTLGRYADAEELEIDVLRRRKHLLGAEHPDTINASAHLASTYVGLGRYAEAEELQVTVLRERKQLLGTEHPDTIHASANLAITYACQGRHAEAEDLEVDVLRLRKQLLGPEHPRTIAASAYLAVTYNQQGRHAEAEGLLIDVLRQRKHLLGVEHPDTIHASAHLARTYVGLGRYADAEELQIMVLRQLKQVLGTEHPDTTPASADLAATYACQGRHAEAEELEADVLRQQKQLLGVEHPSTIIASANLATRWVFLGRHADAVELQVEVLRKQTQLLGSEHPMTIDASGKLAFTYGLLGRYTEAAELLSEVLRWNTSILGEHHLHSLQAMILLAQTYQLLRRGPEATSLARRAKEIASETLGDDHPLYKSACEVLGYYATDWRHPLFVFLGIALLGSIFS